MSTATAETILANCEVSLYELPGHKAKVIDQVDLSLKPMLNLGIIGAFVGGAFGSMASGNLAPFIAGAVIVTILFLIRTALDSRNKHRVTLTASKVIWSGLGSAKDHAINIGDIKSIEFSNKALNAKIATMNASLILVAQPNNQYSLAQFIQKCRETRSDLRPGGHIVPAEEVR